MKGIGTDIVQISRISKVFDKQADRFVDRILTDNEKEIFLERRSSMHFLANRFAAKEAIAKALGTGIAKGVRFEHMEVLPNEFGQPQVNLTGVALEVFHSLNATDIQISLSDEADYAVAFVVIV